MELGDGRPPAVTSAAVAADSGPVDRSDKWTSSSRSPAGSSKVGVSKCGHGDSPAAKTTAEMAPEGKEGRSVLQVWEEDDKSAAEESEECKSSEESSEPLRTQPVSVWKCARMPKRKASRCQEFFGWESRGPALALLGDGWQADGDGPVRRRQRGRLYAYQSQETPREPECPPPRPTPKRFLLRKDKGSKVEQMKMRRWKKWKLKRMREWTQLRKEGSRYSRSEEPSWRR